MQRGVEHRAVGGTWGYWLRRATHLSIVLIPILYYQYIDQLSDVTALAPYQLIFIVLGVLLLLEVVRLLFGWTVIGQRPHEAKQVSSFAWGVLAVSLVLLLAPQAYAVPIIWSCAIVDPLLGELRRFNCPLPMTVVVGLVMVAVIWWIATLWLGVVWWWALVMAPITVLAEWPCFRWIDDNALMQLVPLVVVLIFA